MFRGVKFRVALNLGRNTLRNFGLCSPGSDEAIRLPAPGLPFHEVCSRGTKEPKNISNPLRALGCRA